MKAFKGVAAAAVFLAIGAVQPAAADDYSGKGFSGVAWFAEPGAKVQRMGDVHIGKIGLVLNIESQGQRITSVVKWDSDVAWSLMHDQKMYMEVPPEQVGLGLYAEEACWGYAEGKKIGTETVSGRSTEKWACSEQTITPEGGAPSDATVWYDPELAAAIKSLGADGSLFEVRDIKVGEPSASLYAIPKGYKKFDMNAMMMQMQQMPQMPQQ